jgi:hypothetical protein
MTRAVSMAERKENEGVNAMKKIITPLSNVVRTIQDTARSDAEAVALLSILLGSGRVAFARDVRPLLERRGVAY